MEKKWRSGPGRSCPGRSYKWWEIKENGTLIYLIFHPRGKTVASLPSKSVVFSLMEKWKRALPQAPLTLHHEMKLVGITILVTGPGKTVFIVNP